MNEIVGDDIRLIAEVQEGNQMAMKALVEKYKKKAYFLALGMVGNSDEAFDISQEAFIRVFKSAKTYDKKKPFFPWFYSIIVNLCKDCLKRRQRQDSKMVGLAENDFLLVDYSNPETKLIKEEQVNLLRTAVMNLDFDDREIIMLKHFRELSYDEIAMLLNIPKGTVMSRLYYARKKLAKMINE